GLGYFFYVSVAFFFVLYALFSFLPFYFGANQAAAIVESVPEWIIDGLGVAGGILPAIGFAMLLKIMLKKEYIMFMIVGFVLAAYLELPILAIALIGLAIALYDFYKSKQDPPAREEEITDGI